MRNKQRVFRGIAVAILVIASVSLGYVGGSNAEAESVRIPVQSITAPAPGTTRIIYSLDQKQNDQELIALINEAEEYIYFAIYTFTLPSIADALVEAKRRGVEVKGLMDSEQSSNSYGAPITEKLKAAGIPLLAERHASGNGIMHIKLLVTEQAYAFGSYNWTNSATTINDELIEVGTDPAMRQAYENVLLKLFSAYRGNAAAGAAAPVSIGTIEYTEASSHIGDIASVRGKLVEAYTSKSGTVFLDFCPNYKNCPFSGVIFADDAKKFGDLSRYAGKIVTLTGKISLFQGRAEIVLKNPNQLTN